MRRFTLFLIPLLWLTIWLAPFSVPHVLAGGADLYVSAPGSVTVGQTVTVNIMVNTNGQSANSFDSVFSFPANLLTPVRGATGAVCNLYVSQPDPTSNPDEVECGKSNGFTGSGSIGSFVFTAAASGTANFGLSSCQVLANDGLGTDITGGCSGSQTSIAAAPTPTPKIVVAATPKPTVKAVTSQTPKPAETPHTPTPTVAPTPPPVQALPSTAATPNPVAASKATASTSTGTSTASSAPGKRRTIGQAVSDLFGSLKDLSALPKDITGVIALLLVLLPTLAVIVAGIFLLYRLFGLERRRRRTMDRLFEMELSELSALEGKMDLLTEKGPKGKEEYKDEFEKAKANILREIHPDYGKPVDPPPAATSN